MVKRQSQTQPPIAMTHPHKIADYLNSFGLDGWNLVIQRKLVDAELFIFKREVI